MKVNFKTNILIEKSKYSVIQMDLNKNYKVKNEFIKIKIDFKELKNRIKYILSMLCDFSSELSVRFCDTDEMSNTNRKFRKKKYPTDVLSFPNNSELGSPSYSYLGDILICIPVCLHQAKKARRELSEELEKMIIHGILHLKGFDHERGDFAFRVMDKLEKAVHKEVVLALDKSSWCQIVSVSEKVK